MNRRELLKTLGLSGLAVAGVGSLASSSEAAQRRNRTLALRFAFLTDIHAPAQGRDIEVLRAIEIAQTRYGKLDFIFFGGDNVFAADVTNIQEAEAQLNHWKALVSKAVSVPSYSVIGNHDIWGLRHPDVKDYNRGKKMAAAAFGMPGRYYSFERSGWKFIALDTIHRAPNDYRGAVDKAQVEWFTNELQSSSQPTIVVGHAPILSVTPLVIPAPPSSRNFDKIMHTKVVSNHQQMLNLIKLNPEVKLVLSGHTHMMDSVRFRGTQFCCGGAVSGAWWQGDYEGFKPGFLIVEAFTNGQVSVREVSRIEA